MAEVVLLALNLITLHPITPYTMTYTNMPVIIPVLATGYLLTVYLLLMLAQRNSKEEPSSEPLSASKPLQKRGVVATRKVSGASSVR